MSTTLDCRGMPCPRPVIELAKAVAAAAVGEVVELVADDVAARADVAAWCRMRGQALEEESVAEDGVPVYRVRRVS